MTFRAQAHYPGDVEIGTCVGRVGRSSCTILQGLFKNGICFATARSVVVWIDLNLGGRSLPIPSELAERLRRDAERAGHID